MTRWRRIGFLRAWKPAHTGCASLPKIRARRPSSPVPCGIFAAARKSRKWTAGICTRSRAYWTLRAARSNFPGGRFAERAGNWLYFPAVSPPPEPVRLVLPGKANCPACAGFLRRIGKGGPVRDDPFRQALSCDALKGAVLRTRRAGDWIQPLGMEGKKAPLRLPDRSFDRSPASRLDAADRSRQ